MVYVNQRHELEALLLVSLINSNGEFIKYRRNLSAEFFSNKLHRKIFDALINIHSKGGKFDLSAIQIVGNLSSEEVCTLSEILMLDYSSRNIDLYIKKLTELIIQEKLNDFKLTKHKDIFEAQGELQKLNLEISQLVNLHTRKPKETILSDFEKYLSDNRAKGVQRIKTPFPTLTNMLSGGFSQGAFVLVGGVPGSGKTSFLLQLALESSKQGFKTYFIESEMTELEIFERCVGILTGSDIDKIRKGDESVSDAISQLELLPIEFYFDYKRTLSSLVNEVELAAVNGASMVIVDYLQVYAEKSKASSDEFLSIKKVSEELRRVSLKYNLVLIVASSLNRNEITSNKPGLNSLYGSSGLGHDCSQAIILHGEQSDESELLTKERSLILRVVKNRTGVRGEIKIKYLLDCQRMVEVLKYDHSFQNQSLNVYENVNDSNELPF